LPREDLLALGQKLLEIERPLLEEALALETVEGGVLVEPINGQPCVFLPYLRHAEDAIAEALRRLQVGRPPWPGIDTDKTVAWVEKRLNVTLASGQRQAVAKALAAKILIVTGGPGVGKTTIIRAILAILRAKGVTPLLAAPTGRAANRLSETTGLEARTIHRLLEVDSKGGGFLRSKDLPLECDLLVLDEVSMVDVPLMASVLKALPGTRAISSCLQPLNEPVRAHDRNRRRNDGG
jgi:exodeoxyribonuclease V alpha subunit